MKLAAALKFIADGIYRAKQAMGVLGHIRFGQAKHLGKLAQYRTGIIHDKSEVCADLYFKVGKAFARTLLDPANLLLRFCFRG